MTGDDSSEIKSAVKIARKADIIIAAVGEPAYYTGESKSRTDIRIPDIQRNLLRELKKLNKPTGIVLMNGRPLDLS